MQKKDKYILFSLAEFDGWLSETGIDRAIRLIQNHHTYIPGYKHFTGNNHFQLLEGMERAHIERGFSEIAQNLTTFPDGSIAVCRPIDKIPAGIKGANQTGICIENLGNFDDNGDVLSGQHRESIIKLNVLLCRKFALTPDSSTIVYHHWYDLNSGSRTNGTGVTKSCPGTNFFGGNTVLSAETNFIPLVSESLLSLTAGLNNVTTTPLRTAEVKAARLNVRRAPDTLSSIVAVLNKGAMVHVYEERGKWFRIHPSEQHWVFGRHLNFAQP